MALKGNSILLRAPELEPHHQMQLSVMPKTIVNLIAEVDKAYQKDYQLLRTLVLKTVFLFFSHDMGLGRLTRSIVPSQLAASNLNRTIAFTFVQICLGKE